MQVLRVAVQRAFCIAPCAETMRYRHIQTCWVVPRQWTHLEQQSFPMPEAEYMEKLNNIAFYLGCVLLRLCKVHAVMTWLLLRARCIHRLGGQHKWAVEYAFGLVALYG